MPIIHVKQKREGLVTVNGKKMHDSCTKCMFNEFNKCVEITAILAEEGLDDCSGLENGYYIYVEGEDEGN